MKRYQTQEAAIAPPHIHDWQLSDVALPNDGECSVYRCSCGGRRIVWEMEAPEYVSLPSALPVYEAQPERLGVVLKGAGIGLLIVAGVLLVTRILTGRFWP